MPFMPQVGPFPVRVHSRQFVLQTRDGRQYFGSVHPSRRQGPAKCNPCLQRRRIVHSDASRLWSIHRCHSCLFIPVSVQRHSVIFSWAQGNHCYRSSNSVTGPVSSIVGLGRQFRWSSCHFGPRSSRSTATGHLESDTEKTWNAPRSIPSRLCISGYYYFAIGCSKFARYSIDIE